MPVLPPHHWDGTVGTARRSSCFESFSEVPYADETGTEVDTTETDAESAGDTTGQSTDTDADTDTTSQSADTDADTDTTSPSADPDTDTEVPAADLEELKGIGPAYAGRLREAGIEDVAALAAADAADLAERTDIAEGRLQTFVERAAEK